MPSHDTLTWTWTAPSGAKFSGPPDYIDGVKAGWEARAWTVDPPSPQSNEYRDTTRAGGTFYLAYRDEKGTAIGYRDFRSAPGKFEPWEINAGPFERYYEPVTNYDDPAVHAAVARQFAKRCKFSTLCEHAHPDDIANHTDGGTW